MDYQIVLRGKQNPTPIKQVRSIPSESGVVSLKFPCLSVHVTGQNDDYGNDVGCSYFTVTWSNYFYVTGENPGKFKIQRVEHRAETLYVLNSDGRKHMVENYKTGLMVPVVDQISMNLRSEVGNERIAVWERPPEAESIDLCRTMLNDRFGSLGNDILSLFLHHDLFLNYWTERVVA